MASFTDTLSRASIAEVPSSALAGFDPVKIAAKQAAVGAGAGAVLGLLGSGVLSAGLIVGGGALVYLYMKSPELADNAPVGQFAWLAATAAIGAAITGALR